MDIIASISFSLRPEAYRRQPTRRAPPRVTPHDATDSVHPDSHFSLFEQFLAAIRAAYQPLRKTTEYPMHKDKHENVQDASPKTETKEDRDAIYLALEIAALNQEEKTRLLRRSTELDVMA